jgi:hypothetical protein
MNSLDYIHTKLSSIVPLASIKREDVAHIGSYLFCPSLACKGILRVHSRNGTYVALAEGGTMLYARCADYTCRCSKEEIESGWMDVVCDEDVRPWVKLTVEKLAEFSRKIQQQRKRKHPGHPVPDDDSSSPPK